MLQMLVFVLADKGTRKTAGDDPRQFAAALRYVMLRGFCVPIL
jgi:hypothetical protein